MIAPVAMVFAAGFGSRMGELTRYTPKPLLRVNGEALLDLTIARARAVGVGKIVVNTHYHADQIAAHVHQMPDVVLSYEPEILETGGGLRAALPMLGPAPVLTLNADAVFPPRAEPLSPLLAGWVPSEMSALLLLTKRDHAIGHTGAGDFNVDDKGRLSRRGDAKTAPYVYTGCQIIATDLLNDVPETVFSLNVVWDQMLAEGRLYGVVHDGPWVDAGSADGLEMAEQLSDV